MKKLKLFSLILLGCSFTFLSAQDEPKPEKKVKFYGRVHFQTFYDTYNSVEARDGGLLFYPKEIGGNNDYGKLGHTIGFSRLGVKYSGGEAFGGKVSGVIEGDFYGTSDADLLEFRLRQANTSLTWNSGLKLTMGQAWHTIVETKVLPSGLLIADLPFWPLNRSPQISVDYTIADFNITGAALMHSYHKSTGSPMAQRYAGIPELAFKLKYSSDFLVAGINGGVLTLQPRVVTDTLKVRTDKSISTKYLGGFFKVTTSPVTVKGQAIIGSNLTHFRGIGGIGAMQDPTITDDYDYSALNTVMAWGDIHTNGKIQAGLFFGYTANSGSKDNYYTLKSGRGENVSSYLRIAPRVVATSDKLKVGLEYAHNAVIYGTLNTDGSLSDLADPSTNGRITLYMQYDF